MICVGAAGDAKLFVAAAWAVDAPPSVKLIAKAKMTVVAGSRIC